MSPSPAALKLLLQNLLTSLNTCNTHIQSVRTSRHLSSSTLALDALQSSLSTSASSIQHTFSSTRNLAGSRLDLGDEPARAALTTAIKDLSSIEVKLKDLASRHVYERGEKQNPGFNDMRRRWEGIRGGVEEAIEGCGSRFQASTEGHMPSPPSSPHSGSHYPSSTHPSHSPSHSSPRPHSNSPHRSPHPNPDEETISKSKLAAYENHMRNSWEERPLPGRGGSCFVNMADEKIVRFEKPDGFVRCLPRERRVGDRNAYVEDYEESEAGWSESRY